MTNAKPSNEQDSATIELPVDVDGVPIRIGDHVWMRDKDAHMVVTRLSVARCLGKDEWCIRGRDAEDNERGHFTHPLNLSHKAPDSLKLIKRDTYDLVMAEFIEDPEGEVEKIFERIERLFNA